MKRSQETKPPPLSMRYSCRAAPAWPISSSGRGAQRAESPDVVITRVTVARRLPARGSSSGPWSMTKPMSLPICSRAATRPTAPPATSRSFTWSGSASRTASQVSCDSGTSPAFESRARQRTSSSGAGQRMRTMGSGVSTPLHLSHRAPPRNGAMFRT